MWLKVHGHCVHIICYKRAKRRDQIMKKREEKEWVGESVFLSEKKKMLEQEKKEEKCFSVSSQQMLDGDKQINAVVIERQKHSSRQCHSFFFLLRKIKSSASLIL